MRHPHPAALLAALVALAACAPAPSPHAGAAPASSGPSGPVGAAAGAPPPGGCPAARGEGCYRKETVGGGTCWSRAPEATGPTACYVIDACAPGRVGECSKWASSSDAPGAN
jgi:hypothetical protein